MSWLETETRGTAAVTGRMQASAGAGVLGPDRFRGRSAKTIQKRRLVIRVFLRNVRPLSPSPEIATGGVDENPVLKMLHPLEIHVVEKPTLGARGRTWLKKPLLRPRGPVRVHGRTFHVVPLANFLKLPSQVHRILQINRVVTLIA